MSSVPSIARRQRGFVTRGQARRAGVTDRAIDGRLARGTWQRVLPGILLTRRGPLDADDRATAALLYAGRGAAVTAHVAAARHGIRYVPHADRVTVVAPPGTSARSRGFVRVIETRRPPPLLITLGGLTLVPAERAVADTARMTPALDSVRAMVADAVQRGICGVEALNDELTQGPRRDSRLLRTVLAEVRGGARSAPEARLLASLGAAGLPAPDCNRPLVRDGRVVAVPDFCWEAARLIVEVDSREWHLSPDDWHRTMRRHNRLQALGYVVLHFPPSRIRTDIDAVVAEISAAYHSSILTAAR